MEKEIRALPTPAGVITVTDRKTPIPFGIEEIELSDEAAGILKNTGCCLYIVIDTDRLQNGKVYSFSWGGNCFEFYDSDEFESTYRCESSGWVLEFSMPDIDDIALHHRDGFDAGYEFVDYPNSKPNGFSFALTENRRRFIKFPIGWPRQARTTYFSTSLTGLPMGASIKPSQKVSALRGSEGAVFDFRL